LERSAGYALTGELAPPVHDVGIDAVRHCHLGDRRARLAALGQYLASTCVFFVSLYFRLVSGLSLAIVST